MAIGMPGASPAGALLGFGGTMSLADQIANEDEETRRRRLQAMAASRPGGVGADYSAALSPAATSFLGG